MNPSHLPSRARRGGFTLVELLIVIVIIGLLVGLVSVAAVAAMKTARNAKMTLELNEMSRGLQDYKNKYGQFPPCHASLSTGNSAEAVAQRGRIQRHVAQAFPRYRRDADANGTFGDYYDFRADVLAATTDAAFASGRDIDNLDPAEAMVFWLAGLPARHTTADGESTSSGTRLIGFAQDAANPFNQEDPMFTDSLSRVGQPQRTDRYAFDDDELTDNDNDGWYEYTPEGVQLVAETRAPFVYFDAASYRGWYNPPGGSTKTPPSNTINIPLYGYPSTTLTNHGLASNATVWGVAWPMWEEGGDANSYPEWEQADGFQIICCGLDGTYTGSGGLAEDGPTLFPDIPGDSGATPDYQPMLDNLTSFTEGTLETERDSH